MSNRINSFRHALKAEWVKGRRTFLRYSPIVFAVSALLLLLPMVLKDFTAWQPRISQTIALEVVIIGSQFWIMMVLPAYCIVAALQSFYSEHTQSMWKHINVQPVTGVAQTLAKHFCAWCYVALATTIFFGFLALILLVLQLVYSDLNVGLNDTGFWFTTCKLSLWSTFGGVVIISILNSLAARVPGTTITLLIGFLGMLMPIFVKTTDSAARFLPWMIEKVPIHHLLFSNDPYNPWWVIVPFAWIALCLAVHCAWQRLKPLY